MTEPLRRRRAPGSHSGGYAAQKLILTAVWLLAALTGAGAVWAWLLPATRPVADRKVTYRQELAYQYTVRVQPSSIYPDARIGPEQLAPCPAARSGEVPCRRLATHVAEAVDIAAQYHVGVTPRARFTGTVRWAATLAAPGYWERPLPVWAAQHVSGEGHEATVSEQLSVRMADIYSILDTVRAESLLPVEQVELRIQPLVDLEIAAAGRTVAVRPPGDLVVRLVGRRTAEFPDRLTLTDSKTLQDVRQIPNTVTFGEWAVAVPFLRHLFALAAGGSGLVAAAVALGRRQRRTRPAELARLPVLQVAAASIPPGNPVVVVTSARELRRVQALTDKPVLYDPAEQAYYLLDGTVCYRFPVGEARPCSLRRHA